MAKRLPENKEARYQERLQRGNHVNKSSGHSERVVYVSAAADNLIAWANTTLPKSEAERIFQKYLRDLCQEVDPNELRGNAGEFRAAWGQIGMRVSDYEHHHGRAPAKALVIDWVSTEMEPIGDLPVPVPDKDLVLRWSRPIRGVAQSEVERMGEIRARNLERAGIGRQQVLTAERCLYIVGATPAMTLGQAFNF